DGEILPGHWRPKGWNAMSAVNGRGDKSNPIERTSSAFRRHSDKSGKQPKAIESLRRAERLFVTELTVLELLRLASAIGEEKWNPTAYRAHGKLEDFLLQFWDPQLRTRIREEMLRQAADWLAVKYAQRALKGSFMNAREAIQSATRLIKALTTWATVLPEKAQEPLIEALAAIAAKRWDDARGPRDKLAELVWADVDPP